LFKRNASDFVESVSSTEREGFKIEREKSR